MLKDGMAFGEDMDRETITVTISDFEEGWFSKKYVIISIKRLICIV